MAGKDGKVEPKSGDVVRQGFMVKRSQNKKRFTPVNYKQRWFVLTRRYLVYYDGDGERRKERGRIAVESVHVVETASLGSSAGGVGGVGSDVAGSEAGTGGGGGGIPPGLPFQVGYREAGQEYTLYLLAAREQDRSEWIRAIRAVSFGSDGCLNNLGPYACRLKGDISLLVKAYPSGGLVCSENPGLSGRYHAGLWSGKRWSCCRLSTRSAEGCDTCSSWSSKPLNATNPSSTSTSSFTSATGSTIATTAAITDRPQTTNSEANNNPVVHSQARSTIDPPPLNDLINSNHDAARTPENVGFLNGSPVSLMRNNRSFEEEEKGKEKPTIVVELAIVCEES
ncbi:Tyrosine-protein kinase Btk29A [Eufriesea mexicana]|nr:Tyrosine-protein kinase Btk29A [Eufriesea mexicana]